MFKTILNIIEFICVVVLWIEYRKLYKKYTYYKDKSMEPVIHKLKTEEAPVLDTEKRLYAKERFKGIISTFLEEFYGKTYKTITNKRKRDMRLNLIPLLLRKGLPRSAAALSLCCYLYIRGVICLNYMRCGTADCSAARSPLDVFALSVPVLYAAKMAT